MREFCNLELPDIWVAASTPAGAKALRDYLVRPIIRETVMKRVSEVFDALEDMDTLEDFERRG